MANGNFTFAKGRTAYYGSLPATNDALIVVLLKATGLETDATLRTYRDLATLLAAANDEADFTNYTRKTLTVSTNIDESGSTVDVDATDFTYTAAGGGTDNAIGKLIICYDPDTTGGTDSSIIPLTYHDCVLTTTGADEPIVVDILGFYRAA